MKKIGFLSFGHWTPSPQSQTRSASDALLQSIELAVAAEELGADGAYFRVHHFARQLGSPFPLLAACGARTKTDRDRHRGDRHALREPALHGGGRRRSRPDRRRAAAARHQPRVARAGDRRLALFRLRAARGHERRRHGAAPHRGACSRCCAAHGFARPNPRPMFPNPPGLLRLEPYSAGLRERIWWGAGSNATADWAAKLGMNLQSSTLKIDESGKPFHVQQAEQIRAFRAAWKAGRARARAAGVGQPQHLRAGRRPRPRLFRARRTRARTRSASSATTRARSSAAATPPSRTCSSSSSRRTRPSPKPTRCC